VLLKVAGSLKTLPPWAGSDSSNSSFGNFCGARRRVDGEKKKENKPYPYLGGFPRPPLNKRRIIGLIATGKPSGTYTPYILWAASVFLQGADQVLGIGYRGSGVECQGKSNTITMIRRVK
jgi:hypothetical protein